jgi:ABC-2 type transport system permease protein
MGKILRILRREYSATIRTKAFLIGLVIAPIMMGGSTIVFAIFKDRVDIRDKRIAVVDLSGLVAQAIVEGAEQRNAAAMHDPETGKKIRPAYLIEVVTPDLEQLSAQRLELSDRVRRGELHAFLMIDRGVLHPRQDPKRSGIGYHAKNPALDNVRKWIDDPINIELRRLRLEEAGIDSQAIPDLFHWTHPVGLGLVSRDAATGGINKAERRSEIEAILLPLILPVFLFMMVMMGAQPLLSAIMEEKAQRIAEVLLGSVDPFQLMMGKLLSAVSVALTAGAVYVVGGIIVVDQMDLGRYIPYHILPWFAAHAIMAIFMFGALFTALGSACNDASEAQAVTFPAMLPVIIPMFMLMPVVTQPQSTFATGMSMFPLFTPMLMLIRQATPEGVPAWQPWVGTAGVALTTVFFVWVAGRIFRVGILMQGAPPKLKNLIRWAIRG